MSETKRILDIENRLPQEWLKQKRGNFLKILETHFFESRHGRDAVEEDTASVEFYEFEGKVYCAVYVMLYKISDGAHVEGFAEEALENEEQPMNEINELIELAKQNLG